MCFNLQNNDANFEACDGRTITVRFDTNAAPEYSTYNEVIGTVQNDGTIKQEAYTKWGEKFGMLCYKQSFAKQ